MPLFALALPFLIPSSFPSQLKEHQALTLQKTRSRLDMEGTARTDIFTSLVRSDLSIVSTNGIGKALEGEEEEGGEGKAQRDVDIQYLANQSHVLIVGGSETTATVLAGASYFLPRNPATLSRLQAEVRDTFKDYDEITGDSTAMLPYLNAVIEECLRLFPPSSLGLPRICPGTTIDGRYVPVGTIVSTDPFSMTRDPKYWKDPDSFMPERWLLEGTNTEETIQNNKAASQPFSTGPRACLGKNLAWLETRLTLAKMAWKYDWEVAASSEGVDWWRDIRMWTLWKMPNWRLKFREAGI
jgi:cytochrome P450